MADKRAIAQASRQFLSAIQSSKAKDVADMPIILDRFKQQVGGTEAIADMLVEDFQRVRGANLPPEEKEIFHYKEQIIQKYHQILLREIGEKDNRISQYDLSSLTEDDLRSILLPLAIDMIRKDPAFRADVLAMSNVESEYIDVEYTLESKDEPQE